MKKILFLSTITPNEKNEGGPSGLVWEIIDYLKKGLGFDIHIHIEKNVSTLSKLGINRSTNIDYSMFDEILVYPVSFATSVPKPFRIKTTVLGPDAITFLYARFVRTSYSLVTKSKNVFLLKWFTLLERRVLSDFKRFVVVGKNDRLWVKKRYGESNVDYLPHPILSSLGCGINKSNDLQRDKIFVLSGDLTLKYVGNYLIDLIDEIKKTDEKFRLLVVGRKNKWVADSFNSKGVACDFISWIEDYSDICSSSMYVHLVPLIAGAGTKNRVISTIINNVVTICTPVGAENLLCYKNDRFIVVSSPNKMVENMLAISKRSSIEDFQGDFILKSIDVKFKNKLKKIFI